VLQRAKDDTLLHYWTVREHYGWDESDLVGVITWSLSHGMALGVRLIDGCAYGLVPAWVLC
jgi:hypothetical protein